MISEADKEAVNWDHIAARLQQVMATMLHEEGRYYDATFYADALRRTFGYVAAGEASSAGRAMSYERLQSNFGLVTKAEADYLRDAHTISDRMGRERAESQVKEAREEMRRVYREAGKDLADMLRERCNERSMPSRYRRDGVAWAADLIDPTVPKDQYGRVVKSEPGVEEVAS